MTVEFVYDKSRAVTMFCVYHSGSMDSGVSFKLTNFLVATWTVFVNLRRRATSNFLSTFKLTMSQSFRVSPCIAFTVINSNVQSYVVQAVTSFHSRSRYRRIETNNQNCRVL